MTQVIRVISLICQLGFFLGAIVVVNDYVNFVGQFGGWQNPDPRLFEQVQTDKARGLFTLLTGGLIGVVLTWFSLRVIGDPPLWYRKITAALAMIWLPLFPIGTVVGWWIYRWRKSAAQNKV